MSALHLKRGRGSRPVFGREAFFAFLLGMLIASPLFAADVGSVSGVFVGRTVEGVSTFRFPSVPSAYLSSFLFSDLVLVPESAEHFDPARVSIGWNGVATDEKRLLERITYWQKDELRLGVGAVPWKRAGFSSFLRTVQRDGRRLELTVSGIPGALKQARLVFRWLTWADFVPPFVELRLDAPSRSGWIVTGDTVTARFSAWPGAVSYQCRVDGHPSERCEDGWQAKGLTKGWHRVGVKAWNSVGYRGFPSWRWVYVEPPAPPPAPTIRVVTVDPAATLNNATELRVVFQREGALPDNEGFCQLDDGPQSPCASPLLLGSYGEGRHVLHLRGAETGSATDVTWTADRTAPTPTFDSAPPALVGVGDAFFSFGSDEPATFRCTLDDGAATDCEASGTSYSGLEDGAHVLAVVATDSAGNASAPIEHHWTVDTTPPDAPVVTAEPAGAVVSSPDIMIVFSGNEPNLRFDCRLDQEDWQTCTSPWHRAQLAEGAHVASVRAYDLLGNLGPETAYSWSVVLTPPDLELTRVAPLTSPTRETTATFQLDAGGAAIECLLDGASAPSCGPSVSFEVAEGPHRFEARSVGPTGVTGAWIASEWVVDLTPPALVVDYGGTGDLSASAALTVTFTADDAATVTCVLDGAGSPCTSPFATNGLADGPHRFELHAVDAAGNEAQTVKTWVVDTVAPVVTLTNVTPGWTPTQQRTLRVEFTVDDATASPQCRFDNGAWSACSSPWQLSGVVDGDHTASVRALDPAGNVSPVVTHAWTVAAPFAITSVTVIPLTQTSVRVSWRTSIAATTQVGYGLGTLAGGYTLAQTTVEDQALATTHTVTLTGLAPDTAYVAQPRSRSASGALSVGDPVEFRTPRP